MLTWDKSKIVGYDENGEPLERKEGYCMSTDDKPTGGGIANGSKLDEINTGTEYRYDQAGAQWHAKSGGGGGGSGLPAVTSDDNGDVLTVVNGAWDKAAPSGGGGGDSLYIVTFTWDDNAEEYTCDKTYSDILDHLGRGIVIGFDSTYGFSQQVVQNNETTISFAFLSMIDDTIYHTYLQLADNEGVTDVYYGYTLTPDEGGE